MNLAEEQVNQYGECPEKYIVNPICHRVLFLFLGVVGHMLVDLGLIRHLGSLCERGNR
jgi:hypothetical protein